MTPLAAQKKRLAAAIAEVSGSIGDAEWNLQQINLHLENHFAGRIGWVDWRCLDQLGGLTGCDVDHGNGRYPRSIVRNLRHHRSCTHGELRYLRSRLAKLQLDLDSLIVALPGFESADAEREACLLTHQLAQPLPLDAGANDAPLFRNSTAKHQLSLF